MPMTRSSIAALCMLWIACGPAKVSPRVEVTGSVGGATLKQTEVLLGEVVSQRGRIETLVVSISEASGACELAKSNTATKDTVTLSFTLQNDKGDTLHPGTYPVIAGRPTGTAGNYTKALISKLDAACVDAYAGDKGIATGGTVTLSTWSEGASATGTFDLTVGAETLTGSFAANACAGFTQAMLDTAETCR